MDSGLFGPMNDFDYVDRLVALLAGRESIVGISQSTRNRVVYAPVRTPFCIPLYAPRSGDVLGGGILLQKLR